MTTYRSYGRVGFDGEEAARILRKAWADGHPEDERHGTVNFYSYWGCRCFRCRTAKNYYRMYPTRPEKVHEPTVDRVAEHRAFKERLCFDCMLFLIQFRG